MTRYLLDTHVLIWMREDDKRLNRKRWEPILFDRTNEVLFSTVSLWEIAIKRALGKLRLEGDLGDFSRTLETNHGFRRLGLEVPDLCRLEKLPGAHADPFDRLLIAQCLENSAIAVTNDPKWRRYPVRIEF